MHLLLIEDDLDLGRALLAALQLHGFSVEWWRRAADAPPQLDALQADAVLLDLGLPDGSGFDLLARWRRQGCRAPILVITAQGALQDRLAGLDAGADDYLVKPFATEELVSRLRAVLRRCAAQASEVWTLGELRIRPDARTAELAGDALDLSRREFQLLLELARAAGKVVPKSQIAQKLEPLGEPLNAAAIEMHVFNLRKKIGPERIRTTRGVGYALVA
ncbi:response regulator transcription factor [Roseateles sp. BYS78W]|uniref:Response regulator transcription factor n=1 Tax=Pelomonas candidula TaxID=3299025 RepID=A0ABW7H5L2_9BURK